LLLSQFRDLSCRSARVHVAISLAFGGGVPIHTPALTALELWYSKRARLVKHTRSMGNSEEDFHES
jgi:hypothetical protein